MPKMGAKREDIGAKPPWRGLLRYFNVKFERVCDKRKKNVSIFAEECF